MDQSNQQRRFCTNCGAPLSGGAFCTNCGTRLDPQPQAAPVVNPIPIPIPIPVPAPVVVPVPEVVPVPVAGPESVIYVAPSPEQPVYESPVPESVAFAGPAAVNTLVPKTSPLLPLILFGVAALYQFIMAFVEFVQLFDFFANPSEFAYHFLKLAPFAALIVGLVVFTKKKKNYIVAAGFFALALYGLIDCFDSLTGDAIGYSIFAFLFLFTAAAAYAGIAITYLLGKPSLSALKTLGALGVVGMAFLMLIINSAVWGSFWLRLLEFLFCTTPVCTAAILYTPYQEA